MSLPRALVGFGLPLLLALGKPGLDWEHGGYYVANRLARTSPVAADPVIAARLWERSAEMVGL